MLGGLAIRQRNRINHSGRMGQMNRKRFIRIWIAVILSLFISSLVRGSALASEVASLPDEPADGDFIDLQVRDLQLAPAGVAFQDLSASATAANASAGWYRNEYCPLFSGAQGRSHMILMGLLRGKFPARILAADQQALGLSDLVLETLGYTKMSQDWEYPGSDPLQKDAVRFLNRHEPK